MRRYRHAGNGALPWARRLAAAGLLGLALCGCAVTWDDVTSRDFHVADFWAPRPDPLTVLRDSKDGDKRARAFRELKEPKLNGGTDQDQETMLKILSTAALQEPRYYVRLEAMRKLGEFKDARAVPALEESYYKADALLVGDQTTTKSLISTFRCEVLRGLGNNGSPKAADLLVRVVKQPPPDKNKVPTEEFRMVMDECIAAARALKNYPQQQSTEALVLVLKNHTDVALRDCATESLQACTGKDLPADYATWDNYLHHQPKPGEATAGEKKKGLMDLIQTGFGGKP